MFLCFFCFVLICTGTNGLVRKMFNIYIFLPPFVKRTVWGFFDFKKSCCREFNFLFVCFRVKLPIFKKCTAGAEFRSGEGGL